MEEHIGSVSHAEVAAPVKRRRPLGVRRHTGGIPPGDHVRVWDRGWLIGVHPVDPGIHHGGRTETTIHVGRLACLAGLLHGRLVYEVEMCFDESRSLG